MKKFLHGPRKNFWLSAFFVACALAVYNHYSPPSLAVSVGFHISASIFFLVCIAGQIIKSIKNRRKGDPHEGFRFWVSNFLCVLLALGGIYLLTLLMEDAVVAMASGLPSGRYIVKSASSGLYGAFSIQGVDLKNLDDGSIISGSYIFRADLLRKNLTYQITYGEKSRFIFLAAPSR